VIKWVSSLFLLRAIAYIGYIPENDTSDRPDSPTISQSDTHPIRTHDLSNFKLAQNQTELSKQIEELKATVELNVQIMNRLLEALDGRKNQDQDRPNWRFDPFGCWVTAIISITL